MNNLSNKKKTDSLGFTLLETVIYLAIFVTAATFIVGIFFTFSGVHQRQTSINEVNQQISFVNGTIQRLVAESSLVEVPAGVSTSTLTLRMRQTERDKTSVWHDTDNQSIMFQEGEEDPIPLTDQNVAVSHFSVIKFEQPGAFDIVQVGMTVDFRTENPREKFKRTVNTVVSRVTAATFDSHILPGDSGLQIGDPSNKWEGYFSRIGVNANPHTDASIKSSGDIFVSDSTKGLILKQPNGTCRRLTVNDSGELVISGPISCPE